MYISLLYIAILNPQNGLTYVRLNIHHESLCFRVPDQSERLTAFVHSVEFKNPRLHRAGIGIKGVFVYLKEDDALQDTGGAAHLPDGVHRELWPPDVHHGDAEAGGQDGSDGGSTRAVVTDHDVLQRTRGHASNSWRRIRNTGSICSPEWPLGGTTVTIS